MALCALMGFSAEAAAEGLRAPGVGTTRSGVAACEPSAVYWNPAMLSCIKRSTLLYGGALIIGDIEYTRQRRALYQREDSFDFAQPIDPDALDPSKTGASPTVQANPIAPAPTLFWAKPLSQTLTLGLGVYVPFAALVNFGEDGEQRWALQEATILTTHISPAIAWRPARWLGLGVSASYVLGYAQLSKIQDFAAVGDVGAALERDPINQANDFGEQAPPSVRELEVLARPFEIQRAIAQSLTFNAGVSVHPTEGSTIGLSYHHQVPLTFKGRFRLDMDDDFFTQDLANKGLRYKPIIEGDAQLAMTLPSSLWLGGSAQLGSRLTVSAGVGRSFWSALESFDVRLQSADLAQPELGLPDTVGVRLPRRWVDTWSANAMGSLSLGDGAMAWLGAGFESAASPDATVDAASPDGDRLIVQGGWGYQWSASTKLLLDARWQRIFTREVQGSELDLGNGRYDLSLYVLGVHGLTEF